VWWFDTNVSEIHAASIFKAIKDACNHHYRIARFVVLKAAAAKIQADVFWGMTRSHDPERPGLAHLPSFFSNMASTLVPLVT
jgi:hypothetical protein